VASILSHPAVVLGLGPAFGYPARPRRIWLAGAACAVAPDIDAVGHWLGVPYGSLFGHRGLTHSLPFAAALALGLTLGLFGHSAEEGSFLRIFLFLFLCAASHGVLDSMTDGGRGVAFLAPFDPERFFLPWRPIRVSPIGTRGFFGARGVAILESEAVWIWAPALAVGAAALSIRKLVSQNGTEPSRRSS